MEKQQSAESKKQSVHKKAHKIFKMPSAFSILFGIIAIAALLTWIVPSGEYQMTDPKDGTDPAPISGTYSQTEKIQKDDDGNEKDVRQGVWEVIQAPIKGTAQAIDVVLFVLIIGGFLGVTAKTGAIDAFFGSIVHKLKGREKWIIPILMVFFALGGTTYGMQEETVAFYALVIPLVLAVGYNGMVAALIIILGAGVGVLGSTVNPFSTGIASGFANVSIGDGVIERVIILILSLIAAIWFVMSYAAKVKQGKYVTDSKLVPATVGQSRHKNSILTTSHASDSVEFTARRKAVMVLFGLTFVLMVLAVIPWEAKFGITVFSDFNNFLKSIPVIGQALGGTLAFGDWWFNELSMLFLVAAVIVGAVYYWGNHDKKINNDALESKGFIDNFLDGSKDLLAVALIIGVSRGVSVIMSDGQIMSTIINAGEQMLHGVAPGLLPALAFIVYLPLSILVPSTSGLATASMPILAPLADFAHIDRQLIVTAFATSAGVVNMIAPTVASVMGGLALAKVSYGIYLKRTWKFFLIVTFISLVVLTISALISN